MASAYLEHGAEIVLVDPILPPAGEDRERFGRALARDMARLGGSVHVLLTRVNDPRDADALVRMTAGTLWAPGDPLPSGIGMHPTGIAGEVAWWSHVHRALMPGRALAAGPDGVLTAAPGADRAALIALRPAVIIPSVGPMERIAPQ